MLENFVLRENFLTSFFHSVISKLMFWFFKTESKRQGEGVVGKREVRKRQVGRGGSDWQEWTGQGTVNGMVGEVGGSDRLGRESFHSVISKLIFWFFKTESKKQGDGVVGKREARERQGGRGRQAVIGRAGQGKVQ